MSDATKKLHDYLAKSPSVVYPEDVLAYLPAIEAENAKLLELLAKAGELIVIAGWPDVECDEMASAVMHDIRELGVDA